jgi:hypothetical protein
MKLPNLVIALGVTREPVTDNSAAANTLITIMLVINRSKY